MKYNISNEMKLLVLFVKYNINEITSTICKIFNRK